MRCVAVAPSRSRSASLPVVVAISDGGPNRTTAARCAQARCITVSSDKVPMSPLR